jgi:hypothetical protein
MSARVYVGNLPLDVREREIEDIFYKVSYQSGVVFSLVLKQVGCLS